MTDKFIFTFCQNYRLGLNLDMETRTINLLNFKIHQAKKTSRNIKFTKIKRKILPGMFFSRNSGSYQSKLYGMEDQGV